MSELPDNSSLSSQPVASSKPESDKAGLEQQVFELRALTVKLQSGLIALTWLMIFFMFLQVWRGHKDVGAVRQAASQWGEVIKAGNARVPAIQKFITQLVEYARTHPDIQPVLAKYPIQIQAAPGSTPTVTPNPATTTAPAPAPASKK